MHALARLLACQGEAAAAAAATRQADMNVQLREMDVLRRAATAALEEAQQVRCRTS
jgi:hypothetical protein